MPNMGEADLTGVWMFNWEEACQQVRSDMLWTELVTYHMTDLTGLLL